jgi:uncharacterized membrane protein YphA (DoxX/SURF4 family)
VSFIYLAARFSLAIVFVIAGAAKLPRKESFEDALAGYGLLPGRFVRPVSRVVPILEIGVGTLLGFGFELGIAAALAAVVLGVFTIALATNLLRGRVVACGCFSFIDEEEISWSMVVRNAGLVALAVVVLSTSPRALSVDAWVQGSTDSASLGIAALVTVAIALTAVSVVSATARLRRVVRSFEIEGAVL